jgi:type I restriction enzyme S subunit
MELVKLGKVADFINGKAFKPSDWEDKGKKIIRIQNLNDCSKPYNRTLQNVEDKYLVYPNDILVSWSASLGVFEWKDSEIAVLNQHIFKVVPDEKLICKPYLKYALDKSIDLMLKYTHGSTMKHINRQEFLNIEIPLPPIASQRRIADILDKADEIIRKRKEAIALTEQLQKSIFLDMFGDPVINPKGWEKVTLGSQILSFKYGTNSKCHDTKVTEDLPVLRIPNIVEEKILWEDLKFATVSYKEKQDLLLRENDLLFVRSNGNPEYIGRCALFESSEEVIIYASYLIRGRLKSTSIIKAGFVRDVISFPTYRSVLIKQARTTAGNYNINTQGLKSLEIIKPSVEEQEKYLSITKGINKSIATYYKSLQESENLFNSLLQRAFKGEL